MRWTCSRAGALTGLLCLCVLLGGFWLSTGSAAEEGAAAVSVSAPAAGASVSLRSAVSAADGTWVVLPLGELGDPSNTFWQLLYAGAGLDALVRGHTRGCRRQRGHRGRGVGPFGRRRRAAQRPAPLLSAGPEQRPRENLEPGAPPRGARAATRRVGGTARRWRAGTRRRRPIGAARAGRPFVVGAHDLGRRLGGPGARVRSQRRSMRSRAAFWPARSPPPIAVEVTAGSGSSPTRREGGPRRARRWAARCGRLRPRSCAWSRPVPR